MCISTYHDYDSCDKLDAMPFPNLSQHLLVQILSKLDVKSLLRFRCVSKSWRSLISDPYFIKTHLNQSLAKSSSIQTPHNILFISYPFRPYGLYTASFRSADDNNIVVQKIDFLFQSSPGCQIRGCYIMGSCNGLICIEVESLLIKSSKLKRDTYVFNLSTRELRQIPDCDYYFPPCLHKIVGFGYDHCHDDYKLVNIDCDRIFVYSMRTDSWRVVEDFNNKMDFRVFPYGTQLNGAIHWLRIKNPNFTYKIAASRRMVDPKITYEIAAFRMVDEKLRMFPLPSTCANINFHKAPQVGVFEGCLCIVPPPGCDSALWVMKEYGVEQSWTRIDIKFPVVSDMLALLRNEALMDYTKLVLHNRINRDGTLVIWDGENEKDMFDFHATISVDSLLSPFMKMQGKESNSSDTPEMN
ncbi:F-box/kelch-repeat protein At3g06240-like [Cornus florida]|uniref:F-box/kelch-repeat protein At3g06240-like n=1 Tax=Cornus florida TaxID=4283 RepID=UPI00289EBFA1|nr:F-box/kelch-repeat protein At3g06240-like [Cornus florida]XP_059623829.1 F-box/kelch-repeat protein At3g06240-like [Cornus florida]